jgi:hypothetical protein
MFSSKNSSTEKKMAENNKERNMLLYVSSLPSILIEVGGPS